MANSLIACIEQSDEKFAIHRFFNYGEIFNVSVLSCFALLHIFVVSIFETVAFRK